MKKYFLMLVLAVMFSNVNAEDLRSTGNGSAFDAATWVGDGRAPIVCVAGSKTITGTILDSLRAGDGLATSSNDYIGMVESVALDGTSLTLVDDALVSHTGAFFFYRVPEVTDNITILAGHTVEAIIPDGLNGKTVHDLTVEGTFHYNLIDMNVAGSYYLNTGGVLIQDSPGRMIMDGVNEKIGGTAAVVTIPSLRVKTYTGDPMAMVTLEKPLVVSRLLDIENSVINLNGNTLTVGTGAGSAGQWLPKGTFQTINGPGTLTRWIDALDFPLGDVDGVFALAMNGVNRNVAFGGTFTTAGTISVTFHDASGTSPISFTDPDTALTVDKRTNMNWEIAASGLVGTGLSMIIQASGLPGVSALNDLTLSHDAANANGAFSTTGGTVASPQVARTFADATTLGGAYYIASAAASAMPVELTSFTAGAKGSGVQLEWKTATENNNFGFDIERRTTTSHTASTATAWVKIGFVDGHGTTSAAHTYSFVDAAATGAVAYRLKQIDRDGSFDYSAVVEAAGATTPATFTLMQNYPNPFNPSTTIRFAVGSTQHARLTLYNALGQEVATLFDGTAEGAMLQTVDFDASALSSGMYFYALTSGGKTEVRKMQLLR